MNKLKSTISWLLGSVIAKLKKHRVITGMVNRMRNTYPGAWKLIASQLRPFYWTYQARSLKESEEEYFRNASFYSEQYWKNKQHRNRNQSSGLSCNGVRNNRPVIDPNALLERIDNVARRNGYWK